MERISQRDLRALLDLLQQLAGACDLETMSLRVLSLLHSLIPCEIITFNEVNPRRRRNSVKVDPVDALPADVRQYFEPYIPEHPLIGHYERTGDGLAYTLSDFLSQRQFHQLGLYQEFFRRAGVEHQLAVTLPAPASLVVGIALNRARRDFSNRDRLLLNLLRPHLVQAYSRAEAYGRIQEALEGMERGMEVEGYGLVLLNRTGAAPLMTAQARRWLTDYFTRPDQPSQHLPDALQAWVLAQKQRLRDGDDVPPPTEPLVVERGRARLVVRFIPGTTAERPALLVLEELPQDILGPPSTPRLTPREVAVLRLVAQGKTDDEIGLMLGTSHRTVQKHLEHVFAKLGVSTRTAAVARTFRTWPQPEEEQATLSRRED